MKAKVIQYMTDKVIAAKPEDGIRETFFLMRERRVRHIPVVDNDNNLLGIISDRDLRRPDWVDEAPDVSHVYQLNDNLEVRDLMTTNLHVVYTHSTIQKAVELLLEHRIGALPVLNKDEKLVGILSAVDCLKSLNDFIEFEKNSKK